VSYFQHTKRDLAEARDQARQEIGNLLAALAHDSSVKLDDENIDRQTIAEDLITRLVSLSKGLGSDAATLFDSLVNFHGDNPRMPLEGEEDEAEKTQELPNVTRGRYRYRSGQFVGRVLRPAAPLPAVGTVDHKTIRETHNTTTFDGIERHPFEGGYSGMACVRMVMRNGAGEDCGLSHDNAVHDWIF